MDCSTVILQPYGIRKKTKVGKTILEVVRETGFDINSPCGGRGICGKCRVVIQHGKQNLSSPSEQEKKIFSRTDLKKGFRFSCNTTIIKKGLTIVMIPPESRLDQQKMLLKGLENPVKTNPSVRNTVIELDEPSLSDQRSDIDRLLEKVGSESLEKFCIDYYVLRKIPNTIRVQNWKATVTIWNDREIIDIKPGSENGMYGFAVDIGTTKLAGYLVDLKSGKTVATASTANPQIAYGEDVISRISYVTKNAKNLRLLQREVVRAVNQLMLKASKDAGIESSRILDITIAGNTAMHHIFLGITPDYIARMPYSPALQSPINVKSREIGLKACKSSYVNALPTIAGFVGGDAVADILATGLHEKKDVSMLIDIGTNTEIVLGSRHGLLACSCASGPAFEGAHIKHGMRASAGAIEHVWIDPETLELGYRTIGQSKPNGLCGSGIVDCVAEMLKNGIVDSTGKFNMKMSVPRLRTGQNHPEFVVVWKGETAIKDDIVLTQEDVREIQLAKAAIYTGAVLLMRRMRIKADEIEKVFLAGAFGTYVDANNARIIGMYPNISLNQVEFVGNTAGSGARMVLISKESRETVLKIAKGVKYVELGAEPDFQNEFIKATFLPHQEIWRFSNTFKS